METFEDKIYDAWAYNLGNRKDTLDVEPMVEYLLAAHNADKQAYALEVLEEVKSHYWSGDLDVGLTANDIRADIDQAIAKVKEGV